MTIAILLYIGAPVAVLLALIYLVLIEWDKVETLNGDEPSRF